MPLPPRTCRRLDAAIGALAMLVAAVGCSKPAPPPASEAAKPVLQPKEVTIAVAALEAWPRTVRVQGSMLADEDAVIGS